MRHPLRPFLLRRSSLRPLAWLLAVTAAVALSAANCAPAEFTVSPLTGGPCDDELAGQCGGVCTVTEDCPAGQYCASGTCLADCTPGGDHCGSGSVCDDEGRCASGGGQGGAATSIAVTATGGGATTSGGEGGSCGAVEVSFEPQVPTVVLLIDQSGSMNVDFNGQGSRWDVVYDALMNPTTGVVKQLEGQVRFGLALYTYANGPTCPELVEVAPPILNHHAAIDAAYVPESPRADTPTGDSITAITAPLMAVTEPGPKLIILATDGEPDRCEDPNAHDQVSRDEATDAAQAAFAQGIETVIIAVGNQVSQEHQQDMANAGSGRPVPAAIGCDPVADPVNCAPTYEPTSKQALIDAFNEIIIGQRTCIFTLDGQVIPGKECDGTVLVNGTVLGCNDPNGWQLNSPTEIEFLGTACDTILNDANADVSVSFPCDSVVVPE